MVRSAFAPPRPAVLATLAVFRHGGGDPTTRLAAGEWWRATWTPDGPGTVRVRLAGGVLAVDQWGQGGPWLAARVPDLLGRSDVPADIVAVHPAVARALRQHGSVPIGRSLDLYHELLPVILAQRITGGEAVRQWRALVNRYGEPAPGPDPALRVPPAPDTLADLPSWALHRLGIERRRAATLQAVARAAAHLWGWAGLSPAACAARLVGLDGVGEWTIGSVLGPALGDPDAVAVGDFHLKNQVCWALAGEARGTDQRMLELLAPYAGQRGRVVRALLADGWRAPAYGPRRRILPMATW